MNSDISYEKQLSLWIQACEERFISYKKMLEEMHRDKITYPPNDPMVIIMKEDIRSSKNKEEAHLKKLKEEKTYYPGITPTTFNTMVEHYRKISQIRNDLSALERLSFQVPKEDEWVITRLLQDLSTQYQ